MALSSAKQLLDELMGRDRNAGLEEKKSSFSWDSPDICGHFLAMFCPHDLFVNTKADLGTCTKIHDEKLKREYESSSRYQKMGFEDAFLRFCQGMLSDVDKRIRRAKQRLALSNAAQANSTQTTAVKTNDEKVEVLTNKINELLLQVEHLGCEGKVEEAQGIMKLCDQLKEEREAMTRSSEQPPWYQGSDMVQEKQMEVCEVCGAFLIVGDAQQRVDDHLMGKQHVGYDRLKKAVDEILDEREKERLERQKQWDKDREERRKQRGLEDEKRREERKKRVDEGNDRRPDRDRHHRSRSRERLRRSHRSRSRDKNFHSKSRDTDRHRRRSRSPEFRRRHSNHEESRNRRSRHSRSRSGERHRDKRDHKDRKGQDSASRQNGDSPERSSKHEEESKGHPSPGD